MRSRELGACLAFSALMAVMSLTPVRADSDCQQVNDPMKQIKTMDAQLQDISEGLQAFPSACAALDAADQVYRFSNGGLINGESVGIPDLQGIGVEWLDCDWVSKTLAPQAKIFEKKHPEFADGRTWWRDQITLCEKYPAPKEYRISKAYTAISGVQVALYTSKKAGMPPILAFAGTQDLKDVKTNVQWGAPQMREFAYLKGSVTPEEPWYFMRDIDGHRGGNLNRKFRMKTSDFSETLTHELAQLVAQGKDIVITGHSLGGALAQATAYFVQMSVKDLAPTNQGQVHVYTWNGLGAKEGLDKLGLKIDPKIAHSIRVRNIKVKGDLVPSLAHHLPGSQSFEIETNDKPSWLDFVTPKYHPTQYHSMETIQKLYGRDRCRGFREK